METLLWSFETVNKSINVIGSTFSEAVYALLSWESPGEVLQIKVTDPKSGESRTIKESEIILSVNNALETNKNTFLKKGLTNYGGFSCYMDSVLVPVLLINSKLRNELLTKTSRLECGKDVQEKLRELKTQLESDSPQKSCGMLFNSLKQCETFQRLTNREQQDDGEFFVKLMGLFGLEPTTVKEQLYVFEDNWKLKNDRKEKYAMIETTMIDYPENKSILEAYQEGNFADFTGVPDSQKPTGVDDKTPVNYIFRYNRILDSDYLIFHTARVLPGIKLNTKVGIPETIKNKNNNKEYELTIVTVHIGGAFGGHYISFFKFNNIWYLYDDASGDIKPVDFEKYKDLVSKNSSLIFYI